MQIRSQLATSCQQHADRPAIGGANGARTYGDLEFLIAGTVDWLCSQASRCRTMILPSQDEETPILLLAAITAGLKPFIGDATWPAPVLRRILERYAVSRLVMPLDWAQARSDGHWRPKELARRGNFGIYDTSGGEGVSPLLLPDTSFVRFSSGSTGRPRALQFSEQAALCAADTWRRAAQIRAGERVLCLAGMNNGLAFNTSLLSVFLSGAALYLHTGELTPGVVLGRMEEVRPTIVVAFPFLWDLLVRRAEQLSRAAGDLRLAVSSAAPLSATTAATWLRATGIPICHYYGLAEAGPVTFNSKARAETCGRPLPGCDVKVVRPDGAVADVGEEGRLAVKTNSMATAYVPDGEEELSRALDGDGYLLTNDRAKLDDSGELMLTSRIGRVLNIAGKKVDPGDMERHLKGLPGVSDALIVVDEGGKGTPRLVAYVASRTCSRPDLVAHCRNFDDPLLVPHEVHVVPDLPRSVSGKVLLSALNPSAEGAGVDASAKI